MVNGVCTGLPAQPAQCVGFQDAFALLLKLACGSSGVFAWHAFTVRVYAALCAVCAVCTRVGCVPPISNVRHTPLIETDSKWLRVVTPPLLLCLLGSQVVTMSPVACRVRCIIHVPRSVVARALAHER